MKTIDRDKLLKLMQNDPYWLQGTRLYDEIAGLPYEEHYTLQEAAQVFIQKARNSFGDMSPSPSVWLQGLATVVELWSAGIEESL